MYLKAACCFSVGEVLRMPRPAPPVGQPGPTSLGRNPVPNSNCAFVLKKATWAVDSKIDAVTPLTKSVRRSVDDVAHPSATVERSHSPALTEFGSVIRMLKS